MKIVFNNEDFDGQLVGAGFAPGPYSPGTEKDDLLGNRYAALCIGSPHLGE
jgi:hypothetical protein